MATYQWKASTTYNSDTELSYGVTPNNFDTWQTGNTGGTRTGTWTYWYRDSNTPQPGGGFSDSDSSRVALSVTDSWTATVDNLNNLTISITTTLNSIVRDDIRGNPVGAGTWGRDISVYRQQGGSLIASYYDGDIATAHTILGAPGISLGTRTFTIAPGSTGSTVPSIFLHNQVHGDVSYDDIWIGVQFRNTLPAPVTFSLNYNANGGTGAPATQTAVAVDSATFTVSNGTPTWGSYEFLGWSRTQYSDSRTEADVEYRAGDTITLQRANPSLTLYAVWRMDYIPGKTYKASDNTWYSHNRRPGGSAKLWNGTGWSADMKTINGPTGTDNPPKIKHSDAWHNMRRIGQGA